MDVLAMFHGPNAGYVLDLYDRYLQDPTSVDEETRAAFDSLPPRVFGDVARTATPASPSVDVTSAVRAATLAHNIRVRGHLAAHIDPLGSDPPGDPDLDPAANGLVPADLLALPAEVVGGPLAQSATNALDAITELRHIYAGTTGYSYGHLTVAEERFWLRDAIESQRYAVRLGDAEKRELLERLTQVEGFERFLQQAFPNQKRFSIEGSDMLVPVLDSVLRAAAGEGISEVVMGMAHRGRLNVLAHVLEKPYEQLFAEFREAAIGMGPAPTEGINRGWSGDVKYHLGAVGELRDGGEVRVKLTLASNPSHLEYVDPVIEGMARAAQDVRTEPGRPRQEIGRALPILIHGDAAFPGEGVVAETLNLSRLAGYCTGGTIHIIVNNQLGFTTSPADSRSTLYASDLAKGFEIPVIHVNGDDPLACLSAARLAYAYRTRFHKDVLMDLVGYRRWGHNEGDEPAFTQPLMYEKIAAHPTIRAIWAQQLEREGIIAADEASRMMDAVLTHLREINRLPASAVPAEPAETETEGEGERGGRHTGVSAGQLRALNEALLSRPEGFAVNPRLERQLARRATALDSDGTIDWAHAETLAFASILSDGTAIRLTGQDAERGTFSQRHLVLFDTQTGERLTPLQRLPQARASFAVYNSPLSEAGALGFEYGYSIHASDALVIWEAQFGDFANAAQVIIDQFVAASRAKWRQDLSLVLLLPHGYEGQGPEHSSARLERFLQLAAHDNMRIANLTTSAQYFHLLRRHVALRRSAPRPLVIMTPKSLLRHALAGSRLQDLTQGSFQPVLDDPNAGSHRDEVSRLILCSGKVFVDLIGSELRAATPAVAVARVEQLYPFPIQEIEHLIAAYPHLREVVWLQEEPQNMGAWTFVAPRLQDLLDRALPLTYIGRPERASPAVGSARVHAAEQARLVADAFADVLPAKTQRPRKAASVGVKHAS
ncbi:MAG TPA: 2-oxoglutarate dehydrogenase E1 component [Chloroflexota bacterium]|nr:2-oxoglutarate dehydrogenase E1 component [Chloroflexota bacterium]